jgi:hypothetical protein
MCGLKTVDFTVWDAPKFGSPRIDCVSTHWSDRRLITVSIGRSDGDERRSPPDITIASMDVSIADTTRQGLTLGPLFLYIEPLANAQEVSHAEATNLLVQLSEQPGVPTTLTVEGSLVPARRHDILATGDWAITTLAADVAVCVAGNRGVAVPSLDKANMNLWEDTLLEQIDDIHRTWRQRDAARR